MNVKDATINEYIWTFLAYVSEKDEANMESNNITYPPRSIKSYIDEACHEKI
tara:strand:- start:16 stop:171 length:156 start_codon:yes stop_codon:yes gene_type:complete